MITLLLSPAILFILLFVAISSSRAFTSESDALDITVLVVSVLAMAGLMAVVGGSI